MAEEYGQPSLGTAAEGAASGTIPTLSAGRYDAVARAVDDGDQVTLALDAAGRVILSSGSSTIIIAGGADAEDAAITANPVHVGGRYDATARVLEDGDAGGIAVDAAGRTIVSGQAAENAAAAGNPVLTGGRYDAADRTLGDGDAGAQALDVAGRTKVSGAAAENAAVVGNPVLVGGRYDSAARTLGNGDVGAPALDIGGRMIASGASSENGSVLGNPLLNGGRYDTSDRTLGNGDAGAIALDAAGRQLVAAFMRNGEIIDENGVKMTLVPFASEFSAASGAQQLVAGVASNSLRLFLFGWSTDTAQELTVQDDNGSPRVIVPSTNAAEGGGIVVAAPGQYIGETQSGDDLDVDIETGGEVKCFGVYAQHAD